jgi:hypothetical protein
MKYDVYASFVRNGLFAQIDHWDYSTFQCQGCKRQEGGERFTLEGYESVVSDVKADKDAKIIIVCVDCFNKLHNH